MVYVFLADGFEETEALVTVDIIRRAEIECQTVGVRSKIVTGAHGISVVADLETSEVTFDDMTAVVLPGGMPGTLNLEKSEDVKAALKFAVDKGLLIAAICAAPSILGHMGFLEGKKATCYSGFEQELAGAKISDMSCVADGNIITANGAGAAFEFGFAICDKLSNTKKSVGLRLAMKYNS